MNVYPQPNERLFGIDWIAADEISVASIFWRTDTGGRSKSGVRISLANSATETGQRMTVSRIRARQIAMALAEASGMQFQRPAPFRILPRKLSVLLRKQSIDVTGWRPISTAPIDGTFILLAITGGQQGDKVHEAYWHKGDDRWDADWWLAATGPADYTAAPISEIMDGTPTGWMPKPAAPETRP